MKAMLVAVPGSTFTIQVYGDVAADPSGFGQGRFVLTTFSVHTSTTGTSFFQSPLPPLPAGVQFITATATDSQGNTSEFSASTRNCYLQHSGQPLSTTPTIPT